MGHWYSLDGKPQHFVESKNSKGQRPSTLRDARANGWCPGVTSILDILDKPALTKWKVMQGIQAVVTDPGLPGETLDAKIERVLNQERQQDEEARIARDRGTEIHAALEALIAGNSIDSAIDPWVRPAYERVLELGQPLESEFIIIGRGYGGRCDLSLRKRMSNDHILVDFKSTKKIPTESYMEARWQLGAYAQPYGEKHGVPVSTCNLYISTVNCGECALFENPHWDADYACFMHLVAVWQHMNHYIPQS